MRAVLTSIAFVIASGSACADEKLVAPPYPGAVRLSPTVLPKNEVTAPVEFAVKDGHEKVEGFYLSNGYARRDTEHEAQRQGAKGELSLIVHSVGKVTSLISAKHGDYTWARATEVYLKWNGADVGNAVKRLFRGLEIQVQQFPAHAAELEQVKKKYAYLYASFYLPGKDDEVIAACEKENGTDGITGPGSKDMTEFNNKMKELIAQKRYAEMAELNKKTFGDREKKMKEDRFAEWKKCLDKLDAVSYLTRLTIDRDPNEWDTSWKRSRR